jgi:Acetyltransferase (GNAT) family
VTLVAIEDNAIVGFVSAWITRRRATPGVAGEIDWLWERLVSKSDVERDLAQSAVDWLRERGAEAIFKLDNVQHPRRELWEGLGFAGDVIRFSMYAD